MNYYFLAFEIIMIFCFLLCLRHAKEDGYLSISKLVAGLCFGLLLEWATIQQLQAYEYGNFPLMLGEVPVAIGIGWSVIIYSSGLFTDATNIKIWMRPILDALLALNIDLSMDAIAIRLGMWDWGVPLDTQFFGVPFGNFWAWFWVVFCFSTVFRLLSSHSNKVVQYIAPLGALVGGTAGVLFTNFFITSLVPGWMHSFVITIFLISVLGFLLYQKPKVLKKDLPVVVWVVPLAFHLFFIVTGFVSGVILEPVVLVFISFIMAAVSLLLHKYEILKIFKKN